MLIMYVWAGHLHYMYGVHLTLLRDTMSFWGLMEIRKNEPVQPLFIPDPLILINLLIHLVNAAINNSYTIYLSKL